QHRDRVLMTIGLMVLTASIVAVVALWWVARDEARRLEAELGIAREQADEQLGLIEQDLATLDEQLDRTPRGGGDDPAAPLPPAPAPPAPAPAEPTPADPAPTDPPAPVPDEQAGPAG